MKELETVKQRLNWKTPSLQSPAPFTQCSLNLIHGSLHPWLLVALPSNRPKPFTILMNIVTIPQVLPATLRYDLPILPNSASLISLCFWFLPKMNLLTMFNLGEILSMLREALKTCFKSLMLDKWVILVFNWKVAGGIELLRRNDVAVSHCHCLCIAHFNALCFSSKLWLDLWR